MFGIGFGELLLLLLVILILFGAGKLPSVMRDLGKGIKSFKEGMQDEDKKASNDKDDKNQKAP